MPALGVVEMVARMRGLAPEVPVEFVSGFTAEDRGCDRIPYTRRARAEAAEGR